MRVPLLALLTAFASAFFVASCGEAKREGTPQSVAPTAPQSSPPSAAEARAPGKPAVSVNAMDFSYALFAGADHNGKKKEVYQLELQDAGRVTLTNAFVYGKDTSDDSEWQLLIGDNTPRIVCQQKTREAKMVVANLDKKLSGAVVEGEYDRFGSNRLYLNNCRIVSP